MKIEKGETTVTKERIHQPGRILAPVAGLLMAIAACGPAGAQSFPDHDITFIVPYAPGGGSDQQARRLQAGLEEALGVSIQVVYKEGGGGAVGFLELHSSAPDGYSISNVVVPNIIVTARGEDVGYKPEDFAYIAMTEQAPGAFVVPKDSQFADLEALVAYAKENPGKLTIAGVGSTGRGNFAEIVNSLGIEATYVPVSGGVGDILPYLQGGHVDAAVLGSNHAARHVETIRALGLAGTLASPALPDVPTFASLGYDGFDMATTWGIMAPPGTPEDVVAALNDAVCKSVAAPDVQEALKKNGLTSVCMSPEESKQFVADTAARVDKIQALVEALPQ
jgi:tripartite-type tricarboxylate transporter receptor subunit TctC